MTRLQHALDVLNQKGYAITSLKQLSGGINSAVFQVKSSDAINYALKLYPLPNKNDSRNRCQSENNFLNYLNSCQVHNTPKLIESNISSGWSLMTWIEGQKPISLEVSDIHNVVNFIVSINEVSAKVIRPELQSASEACQSLSGLITSIEKRIKKLQSITSNSKTSQDAIQWFSKTVEPHFQSISLRLLETRANCSHWQDLSSFRIASPSDVGIHNTLRTDQGLYFLDFEYAGLDDLSKLAADWILQPEYVLDQTQEEIFTELLLNGMQEYIGTSWYTRFNDIKPLIIIKWCLIMLNEAQKSKLTPSQFEKTMNYFETT